MNPAVPHGGQQEERRKGTEISQATLEIPMGRERTQVFFNRWKISLGIPSGRSRTEKSFLMVIPEINLLSRPASFEMAPTISRALTPWLWPTSMRYLFMPFFKGLKGSGGDCSFRIGSGRDCSFRIGSGRVCLEDDGSVRGCLGLGLSTLAAFSGRTLSDSAPLL